MRPDFTKVTKQKVQALYNGANPIFTETVRFLNQQSPPSLARSKRTATFQMEYDIHLNDLRNRTLEISVLNNKLNNKDRIGAVEIRLYDINWNQGEFIKWFDLR